MKPLGVVPVFFSKPEAIEVVADCLRSIRATAGDELDVLVVDDGSPRKEDLEAIINLCKSELSFDVHQSSSNEGFSRTVNVGLRRALQGDRDAVLINADVEFEDRTWLARMQKQTTLAGDKLAGIVGGKLLYPNGLIQHGGVYFSYLHRTFAHIHQYAPGDLPEAQTAKVCPVTGALMFIRHSTLDEIGIFDEGFRMSFEDVDFCVRAWQAGIESVYQPMVWAYHHESFMRGGADPKSKLARWQAESWVYFARKWSSTSFGEFVPSIV